MTTLCCDIDGRLPPKLMAWITQCCRMWGWPLVAVAFDRTRRGWHVRVIVDGEVDPAAMVAAQAIFGSDPRREMFNLMRLHGLGEQPAYWQGRWNVLYSEHHRAVLIPTRGRT